MAAHSRVNVDEKTRRMYLEDRVVVLNNVKWFDASGTWLRIFSDEGYTIFNPDKIMYIQVDGEVVK